MAEVKLSQIVPGDLVQMGTGPMAVEAVCLGNSWPHPEQGSEFRCVTWAFPKGHPMARGLRITVDALGWEMKVDRIGKMSLRDAMRVVNGAD